MRVSCRTICLRLVPFVAFVILSPDSFRPAITANGLNLDNFVNKAASKVPNAWKRDPTTGQPRVCKVIEQTLGVATRIVLLGGSSTTSTSTTTTSPYVVEADSNRAALGGNLSKLSIAIDNSRSPLGLLAVEHLELEGSNLRLGWRPLIATVGVPLALFLRPIRQSVWTLSIYYYLWSVARTLAQRGVASKGDASVTSAARKIDQRMQAVEVYADRWKRRILGGSPSDIRFEMVLSNDNLANSTLLRQASKFLLRFLMKNSILQTAATVGDAVSDSQKQQQQQASNQWRQNQNLLKGSSPLEKIGQRQPPTSNGNNPARDNTPKNKLSSLLSATAFELKEAPTFMPEDGKNHLQFVSKAILPDNQGQLEFVLRTTLEAGRGNRDSGVLRFLQPECRFDVTEVTSSLLLPKVVSGLLPKVLWLPIGSGVAIGGGGSDATSGGGGGGLSIRNIRVIPGGECVIAGNLSFLKVPPPANGSGGLVRRR